MGVAAYEVVVLRNRNFFIGRLKSYCRTVEESLEFLELDYKVLVKGRDEHPAISGSVRYQGCLGEVRGGPAMCELKWFDRQEGGRLQVVGLADLRSKKRFVDEDGTEVSIRRAKKETSIPLRIRLLLEFCEQYSEDDEVRVRLVGGGR